MQIKTDWRDNVSEENPVLCWACSEGTTMHLGFVYKFDNKSSHPYALFGPGTFENATPLTKEEALKYIIEE